MKVKRTRFQAWLLNQERGVLAGLHFETGVSYGSIYRAARGEAVRWETAKKLASATGIPATEFVEPGRG
jgi:hypothetical protein